jgi:hypothetical protein
VVAIGGTLWGKHNTYVSLRNRSPVEISCADYLRSRPDAQWLRLTHSNKSREVQGTKTGHGPVGHARPRISSGTVTPKHWASFCAVESRTSRSPRSIFW